MARTGKNKRQISIPQRETKVELSGNNGEYTAPEIAPETCFRICLTRLLRSRRKVLTTLPEILELLT